MKLNTFECKRCGRGEVTARLKGCGDESKPYGQACPMEYRGFLKFFLGRMGIQFA